MVLESADGSSGEALEGYFSIRGGEFEDAGTAATAIKSALRKLGFPDDAARRAAISAFEAEMNVIIHALAGTLTYTIAGDEIQIIVNDMGPGIEDIGKAMTEGFSTAPEWAREKGWGSGLGLPNIKKNSDSLEIDTRKGEGTTLTIKVKLVPGGIG